MSIAQERHALVEAFEAVPEAIKSIQTTWNSVETTAGPVPENLRGQLPPPASMLLASQRADGNVPVPEQLIGAVECFLKRFCILPDAAYLPLAIWVMATHSAGQFDCFPYLALLSPAKRCGKTRLLEVLEQLVHLPWRGTTPTPAALYRMMDLGPTLLLDEVEVFNARNKSESAQAILAILNAGHRRGATIPRCDGPKHTLRHFPVYSPKAFAAIGRLPDTLTDRSIIIVMQRRTPDQKIERFLFSRTVAEAKPVRETIARSALDNEGIFRQAYERLMADDLGFLGDRDADLWIPIFAVCSVVAPERMAELRRCAEQLCSAKADADADDSLPLRLLTDIRAVWPQGQERCATQTLIDDLKTIEESPWRDNELSSRKLARMLRPFGVEPRVMRVNDSIRSRGYEHRELASAIARYVGD